MMFGLNSQDLYTGLAERHCVSRHRLIVLREPTNVAPADRDLVLTVQTRSRVFDQLSEVYVGTGILECMLFQQPACLVSVSILFLNSQNFVIVSPLCLRNKINPAFS